MKYYIVRLSTGEWDDFWVQSLFVTGDIKFAKKYCTKGNRILRKHRSRYKKLRDLLLRDYKQEHPLKDAYCTVSDRASFTMGNFDFAEIDYRATPTKA